MSCKQLERKSNIEADWWRHYNITTKTKKQVYPSYCEHLGYIIQQQEKYINQLKYKYTQSQYKHPNNYIGNFKQSNSINLLKFNTKTNLEELPRPR